MGASRPRTPSEQQHSDYKLCSRRRAGSWGSFQKTVAKWRKRATVEDLKIGPRAPHSTTLSEAEKTMFVAFRRHTLLQLVHPLNERPFAFAVHKAAIPLPDMRGRLSPLPRRMNKRPVSRDLSHYAAGDKRRPAGGGSAPHHAQYTRHIGIPVHSLSNATRGNYLSSNPG